MDGSRMSVPLRSSNIGGKKMRKRRELDALVASNGLKRHSGYNSGPTACVKPGTNYHDQLLSESTDEQEDYWRARTKSNIQRSRPAIFQPCNAFFCICLCLFATVCLLVTGALVWLFVDLRDQTSALDKELKQVVTGNQGTSESLQKCHAETKVLQKNQSDLFAQFAKLSTKMTNLTTEVSSLRVALQRIQDRLKSVFDSSDGPSKPAELPFNISSIHDVFEKLNNTVAQLKASGDSLKRELSEMRRNLTSLTANPSFIVPNKISVDNTSSTEASNALGNFSLLVSTLYSNMTYLNESLTAQIQSMKKGPSLDSSAEEQLNNLLNQNISIRLDGVERKCLELSNAIYNIPLIPKTYNRMNNSSNVTIT